METAKINLKQILQEQKNDKNTFAAADKAKRKARKDGRIPITVYLTQKEYDFVNAQAEENLVDRTTYIRRLLLKEGLHDTKSLFD